MPSRATKDDKDATSELFEELNRALRFCAQEMLLAALKYSGLTPVKPREARVPHAVRPQRKEARALPPIPEEPHEPPQRVRPQRRRPRPRRS